MAIVIEGYTVIARLDCIQGRLSHPTFEVPNSTGLFDEHLWRCSFMAQADALSFLKYLGQLGMKIAPGEACEAVVVDEFELGNPPPCTWLSVARWDKAVIGWRTETEPDEVVVREGWDPKVGSGLTRESLSDMDHLEFLGAEDGVETYFNKKINQKVYIGRPRLSPDVMFEKACKVIGANFVNPGGRPVVGEAANAVKGAAADLEKLLSMDSTRWNVHWFLGKAMLSLGRPAEAYDSFRRAYELEPNLEATPRELAGVCLELGKFDEAVSVAQQAASIAPDSPATVGNLALAQLMAGQMSEAQASIATALNIDPEDRINLLVCRVIEEVLEGTRAQPKSLRELTKAVQPKKPQAKKPFWKFW